MTQSSVLPNMLYINDTRTTVFEINPHWHVKCTVAARSDFNGTTALLLITSEGIEFGRATVLNMVRDKHNPSLFHYTLKCLEPLKLIPTKELTDRLMLHESKGQPPEHTNSCAPYQHPTELRVGDRITTDICPNGRKWDIQLLAIFQVIQVGNDLRQYSNSTMSLRKGDNIPNPETHRTFIVWEQFYRDGSSTVHVSERLTLIDELAQHKLFTYKEPDVEAMVKKTLSKTNQYPDVIFMSSEAYQALDKKPTIRRDDHAPTLGATTILYYDHVPIHEVKGVSGIQVWGGIHA